MYNKYLCFGQLQEDNPTEGNPWDNIVWNSSLWIGAVTNFIDFKFLPPEIFSTDGMSDVTVSILTFILRLLYTFRGVTRPSDAACPIRTLTFSGR